MRRDAWSAVVILLLLSFARPCAAQRPWQPSSGHTQVAIWPGVVPDAQPVKGPEVAGTVTDAAGKVHLVCGRPWIGVLGFSAGGHMVAEMSTHFERRLYPPVDAADQESCRPDFAIALYPGHLWKRGGPLELNPNVPVTSNTPPTFLVQAQDDPVNPVFESLVYYIALKKAGVPVEMHLYAQGGHAFGLRHPEFPVAEWPRLVEKWLGTIGMTSK